MSRRLGETTTDSAEKVWQSYDLAYRDQLVAAFAAGDRFQRELMANPDITWKYVDNFNREYARARYGLTFSTTVSPIVQHIVVSQRLASEIAESHGELAL